MFHSYDIHENSRQLYHGANFEIQKNLITSPSYFWFLQFGPSSQGDFKRILLDWISKLGILIPSVEKKTISNIVN